jgi:hypothetical protein
MVRERQGATQAMEYVTDDLQEAFDHGRALAADQMTSPAPVQPPATRRRWRKPMSARAQRRRMIRAHNHRMRARMLKKQSKEGLG